MKLRMTLATLALGLLGTLSACGTDEEAPPSSAPSPSPSASASPSEGLGSQAPQTAEDLVGTWSDPKAEWSVTFEADGTFTEDFQGTKDFRTGTYTFEDGTVTLEGGDGNSSEGTVEDASLVFELGTLTRT